MSVHENAPDRATVDQRLKVLVVTPLGLGGRGGIDRVMDGLRARLASAPAPGLSVRFHTSRGKSAVLWPLIFLGSFVLFFLRLLTDRPDVVHLNLSIRASVVRKCALAWLCSVFRVPYAVHLHGSAFDEYWDASSYPIRRMIDFLFDHAAAMIVLGESWRRAVVTRKPGMSAPVFCVPNGVNGPNPAEISPPDEPPMILFLGQLGPRKGVPELVEALSQIADLQSWRAVLAGDGEVAGTREAIARDGLQARVTVPGWVGPFDAERLLEEASIVVLPSRAENLPMSVVEGFAYGRAVVATPVGAVPEFLSDNLTGLMVPVGDSTALALALRRAVLDPNLRIRLGEAARHVFDRELSMNAFVGRLLNAWSVAAGQRVVRTSNEFAA